MYLILFGEKKKNRCDIDPSHRCQTEQLPYPSSHTSTDEIRIDYGVHVADRKILNASKHPSVPRLSFCPYTIRSSERPRVSEDLRSRP